MWVPGSKPHRRDRVVGALRARSPETGQPLRVAASSMVCIPAATESRFSAVRSGESPGLDPTTTVTGVAGTSCVSFRPSPAGRRAPASPRRSSFRDGPGRRLRRWRIATATSACGSAPIGQARTVRGSAHAVPSRSLSTSMLVRRRRIRSARSVDCTRPSSQHERTGCPLRSFRSSER